MTWRVPAISYPQDRETPLHIAAKQDQLVIVEFLLEIGCDVEAFNHVSTLYNHDILLYLLMIMINM